MTKNIPPRDDQPENVQEIPELAGKQENDAENSSAELPEPTDFVRLLDSLLNPSGDTPTGGEIVDLTPHLPDDFVLGIVGGRKPKKPKK